MYTIINLTIIAVFMCLCFYSLEEPVEYDTKGIDRLLAEYQPLSFEQRQIRDGAIERHTASNITYNPKPTPRMKWKEYVRLQIIQKQAAAYRDVFDIADDQEPIAIFTTPKRR